MAFANSPYNFHSWPIAYCCPNGNVFLSSDVSQFDLISIGNFSLALILKKLKFRLPKCQSEDGKKCSPRLRYLDVHSFNGTSTPARLSLFFRISESFYCHCNHQKPFTHYTFINDYMITSSVASNYVLPISACWLSNLVYHSITQYSCPFTLSQCLVFYCFYKIT